MPGHVIAITTFGSRGDLYPFLAIGREMKRRGHDPVMATAACYHPIVADAGLRFHPVRPHVGMDDPILMGSIAASPRGFESLVAHHLLPALGDTAQDLRACATDATMMLVGPLSYAAPPVAEAAGISWCATVLSPSFVPTTGHPSTTALRRAIAPRRVLALFSPMLRARDPEWPDRTTVTGFPFYDGSPPALDARLEQFLTEGTPPLVFTLGSAAVFDPGAFFEESVGAARALDRRAVLLTGGNPTAISIGDDVLAVPHAPYSQLFPRAAAIVHHGGIGTVGEALRAGRPMLVVPRFLDQPENAVCVRRLGVARVVHAASYTAANAAREIAQLFENPTYAVRTREIAAAVRLENGTATACDALERELTRP